MAFGRQAKRSLAKAERLNKVQFRRALLARSAHINPKAQYFMSDGKLKQKTQPYSGWAQKYIC